MNFKLKRYKLAFFVPILFFGIFGLANNSLAVVIFETNFEGTDWTHTQQKTDATCLSNCGISNGFQAYRDGMSYCSSVGNNNFYMDTGAGYPGAIVPAHSGSKCLTFWTERCIEYFEDSDGDIGVWFANEQPEIYIAYWIRFDPNYVFNDEGQEKLWHLQYSTNGQSPWSYFSGTLYNFPVVVGGLYRYSTNLYFYMSPRCTASDDNSARCNIGTPSYTAQYNSDFDAWMAGATSDLLNDGRWHHIEYRMKMNTGSVGNYNTDGVMQIWYDGTLKGTWNGIGWNQNEPGYSLRGWKFFSIGGNNKILPSSATNSERWWAVDDLVLSTTYIHPDYVIGGGTPPQDTTPPAAPGGLRIQ